MILGGARTIDGRTHSELRFSASSGGEDDIGGVARAALEVATAEVPVSLHVANDSTMI